MQIDKVSTHSSFTQQGNEILHVSTAVTTFDDGSVDRFERVTSLDGSRVEINTRDGRLRDLPSGAPAFRITNAAGHVVAETHAPAHEHRRSGLRRLVRRARA